MEISTYFVREEERFTRERLFKKFSLAGPEGEQLLSLLLQYGVLERLKQGVARPVFKVSFVGIVLFKSLDIRCYPKYIRSTDTPRRAFAQVMNVLRCYGRESAAELYPAGESESLRFSLIAEALGLLEEYAEHGLYSTAVTDCEYNGAGEIHWDRTLSSLDPFFCNGVPLYLDFHTRRTVDDTSDYVTRLHKHLLTECSRLLEEADMLSMFGFCPLRLSDEPREHFGPDDHILQRLRAELDIQFDCRKQEVLRRLIRFIERRETLAPRPLHLYGVTHFETVWEKACARALGDQLPALLEKLPLPCGLHEDYKSCTTLKSLIRRPEWHLASGIFPGNGTLIPDIAALYRHQGETVFLILDAKYYTYENLREEHPGIGDIDKQFLYEVAFRPFLRAHGIKQVQNMFLLPSEGDSLEDKGHVEFAMLKELGCENIKIVVLPAEKVFAAYLKETPKDGPGEILRCQVLK